MKKQETPTTDERIARINEIISTQNSDESEIAEYILKNWNNAYNLDMFISFEGSAEKFSELHDIAKSRYSQIIKSFANLATVVVHTPKAAETKPTASKTPETEKATLVKKTMRSKHVVGDLHPTEDWVWTEYRPGKFDWRKNKHDNPEINRKERERDLGADKPKITKKATKAEKPVKVRTIEEILATKPQGISKPQERVFKLLRKGYRFIDGGAGTMTSYLKKGDDQQTATLDVVGVLFNRMRVSPEEMNQFKA